MSEYAEKRARTREAFLEVAFEALPGALREGLLAALGPARLARSAGLSRQTFYRYWPAGGTGFIDELAEYILAPERSFASTIIPDLAEVPAADPLTATQLLRNAAIAEFETALQIGPLLCEVVSWALLVEGLAIAAVGGAAPTTGVRDALRRTYNDYADDLVGAYQMLLDEWGREMVPGVSLRQFAAMITGLLDGMGIRWLFDPELASPSLYADAVLALVPAFTRRRAGAVGSSEVSIFSDGEEREASGAARHGPEVAARRAPESPQALSGRKRVNKARAAILAVARAEFSLRGYQATTISGIASAALVGETTVYEHFGTKAGLAASCLEAGHADAMAALAVDESEPMVRLHNHLCRLYSLLAADRDLGKALFDAVLQASEAGPPTDGNDPRLVIPMPEALVPVIDDARRSGVLVAHLDAVAVAEDLVGILLLHVLMKPMDPETACRRLESLVFDGLYVTSGRDALPVPPSPESPVARESGS